MRVAIQGIAGSFHEQAAHTYFDSSIELVECPTFRDVFEAVKSGSADRGVVAIENSLHGPINAVYRLLAREQLWVCGEVRLKIAMYLIGGPDTELRNITTVNSQLPALEQCEQWLADNLPTAVKQETSDTARSVRSVVENPSDTVTAAIASEQAAELYNGMILAGPINDDPDNYTRFVILSKEQLDDALANRTSIIITEPTDAPGMLFKALSYFDAKNINLSKLDSHPLPGEKRQYSFYIDFDASANSAEGKEILESLRGDGWDVQLLGSYNAG
jgi:prephenate dehydratase